LTDARWVLLACARVRACGCLGTRVCVAGRRSGQGRQRARANIDSARKVPPHHPGLRHGILPAQDRISHHRPPRVSAPSDSRAPRPCTRSAAGCRASCQRIKNRGGAQQHDSMLLCLRTRRAGHRASRAVWGPSVPWCTCMPARTPTRTRCPSPALRPSHPCHPVLCRTRLVSLAAQKFIADIAHEALQQVCALASRSCLLALPPGTRPHTQPEAARDAHHARAICAQLLTPPHLDMAPQLLFTNPSRQLCRHGCASCGKRGEKISASL
jgi:hypothetical protein